MSPTPRAHLAMLVSTLLVGGSFLASAALAGRLDPVSLTLLRFVAAAALLAPVVLARPRWRRAVLPSLPRAAVMSLCYAGFFACLFQALETTTPLNTSALYNLVPFATALLCRVLLGQAITPRQLAAYLLGTVAACWVVFQGDLELALAFALQPGDGLFLAGALLMCGYALSLRGLSREGEPLVVLVFAILLTGSAWMGAFLLVSGRPLGWHTVQAGDLAAMAYLVLGATLATVPLTQVGAVTLGPSRVMAYTYLTPGLVAGLGLALHGTPVAAAVLPGIALSALATLLLQRGAPRPAG